MPETAPPRVDKRQVRASFDRAAASYDAAAVLQHEVGRRLRERLELIRDFQPEQIMDLGCGTGRNTRALSKRYPKARALGVDLALGMCRSSRKQAGWFSRQRQVCADAEQLPFADQSLDLVFSSLAIQWVEDLRHCFSEIRRVLKPGGLLLFSTLGPDTLKELRAAWSQVDGHAHVNRFTDMHEVGDALHGAGLSHPVVDMEQIVMTYREVRALMRDLKEIGAHTVTEGRSAHLTGRQRLMGMCRAYEQFRRGDGLLPATYEVVYGIAWAPEAVGQRPQEIPFDQLKGQLRAG